MYVTPGTHCLKLVEAPCVGVFRRMLDIVDLALLCMVCLNERDLLLP